MAKKQALGRGLSSLLSDVPIYEQPQPGEQVRELPVESIQPNPDQPRKEFDEEKLEELAASIREHGIMQPILVIPTETGSNGQSQYMIAAGERRWRAAQKAGLSQVPCLVRELDALQLAELSLIENLQRENLTALEEAEAFRRLMDSHGYTQEALAKSLGKSRPHVANTLRLLNLEPHERKLLADGKLTAGHARAVMSLEPGSPSRVLLVSSIIKDGLSVRQAEELAARAKAAPPRKTAAKSTATLLHEDIASQLSHQMGVRVQITGRAHRGKVVIDYNSEDDLQNIMDAILK